MPCPGLLSILRCDVRVSECVHGFLISFFNINPTAKSSSSLSNQTNLIRQIRKKSAFFNVEEDSLSQSFLKLSQESALRGKERSSDSFTSAFRPTL